MLPNSRFLLLLFLLTLPAWSNMAAPWRSGDAVGEPSADLSGLVVQSESLVLDLRPLGQLKSNQDRAYALVEASYHIVRKGAPKAVDLVFVAPGQNGRAEVWLDDQPQTFVAQKSEKLPQQWQSPRSTPRAGGGTELAFEPLHPDQVLRFRLKFAPGEHTVRVKYDLRPTAMCSGSPLRYWQLAYVLAPARQWVGFGSLDAQVLLPEGWQLATSLPMEKDDKGWHGHWPGVPADFLTLSAQAPIPAQWPILETLAGLCVLVPVGLAWMVGGWLGRQRRSLWWSLPLAWGLAGLTMVSFLGLGFAALEKITAHPPGQSSWNWSYGQSMGIFFGSVPLAAVAWVLAQAILVLAARRTRSQL